MDLFNDLFGKKPTLKGNFKVLSNDLDMFFFFLFESQCRKLLFKKKVTHFITSLIHLYNCFTNFFCHKIKDNISFAEQQRDNDRALRRAGRDIERERHKLENEEKKLVSVAIELRI